MKEFFNRESKHKRQEAVEKEKTDKAFLGFFELTEEQEERLRERVASSGGHIRIIVHPYAGELPYGMILEEKRDRPNREEAINKTLLKWASQLSKDVVPIFIFEEEQNLQDLKTRLVRQTDLQNIFYIIPTFSQWSDVKLYPDEEINDSDHWELLIEKFRDLGITDIIVGGKFLNVYCARNEIKDKILSACVGNVMNRLSDNFSVEASNISSPDSRREVKT